MRFRRHASFAVAFGLFLSLAVGIRPGVSAAPVATRPNILVIVSDDQTGWTFSPDLNPSVYAQLVNKGVLFNRAYDVSPECCPSRSEILTGLYETHTGVDGNRIPLTRPTMAQKLHDIGYHTILAGKYLNSWPCTPRPEFDQWVCSDEHSTLVDPTLNVNGTITHFTGYTTQIEAQFVTNFIQGTPSNQPFFALYTPKSPHLPADDPRYDSMTVDPIRDAAYDQETRTAVMPQWTHRGPLTQAEKNSIDDHHMNMAQSVRALDDDIGSILSSLGTREQNTLVVFISDNGYLYGEHRLQEKWKPYEEATRVPMIVRYPPLLPEGQAFTSDALVENVDIAPTIADLLDFHWGADGLSLVPLITQSQSTIRDGALVEHCMAELYPCYSVKAVTSFNEIDTAQYAYIEYISNEQELYDLVADPAELNNLAYDPGHAGLKAQLSAQLAGLTAPPPTDTTIVTGALGAQHARAFSFTYFSQSRFATYECRLDVDGVTGTWQECDQQPFVEGPLADGDYQFDVRGTDEYGVTDPTPDSQAFSIHEVGPDVQITSAPPADGHSGNVTFGFAGDPSVVRYECKLALFGQDAAWQSCTSPTSYTGLADNLWSFKVRGFDSSGASTDPPAQWLFRVDNTGPSMRFLTKPDSPTRSTSATFEFIPDEPTTGFYSCKLDSGSSTDCSSGTVTYNGLSEGMHSLSIHATDLLGDKKTTTFSWIVDLTAPVAQISSGPPSSWNHDYALFTLDSPTRKVNFTCTLDSNPTIACTRSPSFYQLADGAHTMTVTAFDAAGNVSAPVVWNWTQST